MKKLLNWKPPGNEACYTVYFLPVISKNSCCKLHCQKVPIQNSLHEEGRALLTEPKVESGDVSKQKWDLSSLGNPRKALRGGISKSIFQRPCQFLAINAHKMAPKTGRRLQERARDALTKGLVWSRDRARCRPAYSLVGVRPYYTVCSLLVILKHSCSKLHCQKVST